MDNSKELKLSHPGLDKKQTLQTEINLHANCLKPPAPQKSILPKRKRRVQDRYEYDIPSYNKKVKGFKLVQPERLKIDAINTDTNYFLYYPRLKDMEKGWNAPDNVPYIPVGVPCDTVSALHEVKRELPNTKKRLTKKTYRNVLILNKRLADLKEKLTASKGNVGLNEKEIQRVLAMSTPRVVSMLLPS